MPVSKDGLVLFKLEVFLKLKHPAANKLGTEKQDGGLEMLWLLKS